MKKRKKIKKNLKVIDTVTNLEKSVNYERKYVVISVVWLTEKAVFMYTVSMFQHTNLAVYALQAGGMGYEYRPQRMEYARI